MAVEFYYHRQSPPSCLVWMTLKELGIDYKGNHIDLIKGEQKSEAYTKINPAQQVPAIKDGDFLLAERLVYVEDIIKTRQIRQCYRK